MVGDDVYLIKEMDYSQLNRTRFLRQVLTAFIPFGSHYFII